MSVAETRAHQGIPVFWGFVCVLVFTAMVVLLLVQVSEYAVHVGWFVCVSGATFVLLICVGCAFDDPDQNRIFTPGERSLVIAVVISLYAFGVSAVYWLLRAIGLI